MLDNDEKDGTMGQIDREDYDWADEDRCPLCGHDKPGSRGICPDCANDWEQFEADDYGD